MARVAPIEVESSEDVPPSRKELKRRKREAQIEPIRKAFRQARIRNMKMSAIRQQGKNLDANRYATKKTIAQGMLDIALLTANASQLKYILQVGESHEFYSLMLALISISIILQVIVGILFLVIGGLDINKGGEQKPAVILNDVILVLIFVISVINVIISGFGIEHANRPLKLVDPH